MWRSPGVVPGWLTAWLTVLRDVLATGAGLWGVIHEELSGKADLGRLALFAVLMVAPGALASFWLAQQPPSTGGQSSPPPVPPSPSAPPSPSSNGQPG